MLRNFKYWIGILGRVQSKAVAAMPMRLRVGIAPCCLLNGLVLIENKRSPAQVACFPKKKTAMY